jgi:predicted NAD/FAD-dependent oxidoreductase
LTTTKNNLLSPAQTLVSTSTIGIYPDLSDADLEAKVREQMTSWFGSSAVTSWTHLKTYRIPYAQPGQSPPTNLSRSPVLPGSAGKGLFVAGDHNTSATLDGALVSGREAATALLAAAGKKLVA